MVAENVVVKGHMEIEEVNKYIDYLEKKGGALKSLEIEVDGEFVNLNYRYEKNAPFERIRRITGYLVGTLDRFNNGKAAEEKDRVKHSQN